MRINGSTVTNNGTLESTFGLLDVANTPSNLSGSTLAGGTWRAVGGDIRLPSGNDIDTVSAVIVVDGSGSSIEAGSGTDALLNLANISSSGHLTIDNGQTFASIGPIDVQGTLKIGPTSTVAINVGDSLTVASGGRLEGRGTISGPVIAASGATVSPGNSPGITTINGDFNLNAGSTLEIELGGAGTTPARLTTKSM